MFRKSDTRYDTVTKMILTASTTNNYQRKMTQYKNRLDRKFSTVDWSLWRKRKLHVRIIFDCVFDFRWKWFFAYFFIFINFFCSVYTQELYSTCTAAECRLWVPPSFEHIIDSNVISSFFPICSHSFILSSLCVWVSRSLARSHSLTLSLCHSSLSWFTHSTRIFHILCKVRMQVSFIFSFSVFLSVSCCCCAMHKHFSNVAFGENEQSMGTNTYTKQQQQQQYTAGIE